MESKVILGLMSGSSLDGLDLAVCTFEVKYGNIMWSIEEAATIPYEQVWRDALHTAPSIDGHALMKLDAAYGNYIGENAHQWLNENLLSPTLIASHGHTVFHEPALHYSTQIGSGAHIAAKTRIDTITSFRNIDVALGGQGAPFAPIADRDLFPGHAGYLNLGGIANISIPTKSGWKAWDISPCCQVLNYLAEKTGVPFDRSGQLAAAGTADSTLVRELISHFPGKNGGAFSLSNADVHSTWIQIVENANDTIPNLMASVVDAIAQLVVFHALPHLEGSASIFCTGGGAHNTALFDRLNSVGAAHQVFFEKPDAQIIDFKESLLMAYLGYLHITNTPFGIYEMTGASRDHIGGAYFKATS
jgi:anhydro-N-acetylmuramic acid kinase